MDHADDITHAIVMGIACYKAANPSSFKPHLETLDGLNIVPGNDIITQVDEVWDRVTPAVMSPSTATIHLVKVVYDESLTIDTSREILVAILNHN